MDRVGLVRTSFTWFKPCGPAMIAKVLRELGDENPGIRALFPEESGHLHAEFFKTLGQVVANLDRFQRMESALGLLGARAAEHGAIPAHYRIVRDHLLRTMAELAGDDWTEALATAWRHTLESVCGAMLAGAAEMRAAA